MKGSLRFLVHLLKHKSVPIVENGGGILRNISSFIATCDEGEHYRWICVFSSWTTGDLEYEMWITRTSSGLLIRKVEHFYQMVSFNWFLQWKIVAFFIRWICWKVALCVHNDKKARKRLTFIFSQHFRSPLSCSYFSAFKFIEWTKFYYYRGCNNKQAGRKREI